MDAMGNARETTASNMQALLLWATGVQADAIPRHVLQKAVGVLSDNMAAMIGAREEPEVARFHRRAIERSRLAESTLWRGGCARVERESAAVANALAGSWLELDEGYRPTACHGGLYVLPALLAHAESASLSLREVLRAIVLGYEIVTRVARAWTSPRLTMQAHGRYAAVGAAAGLGVAMRLDAATLSAALGAAATLIGPAPRNHLEQGVLIRNAWAASGAWNGMMAVEWAACGIGGLAHSFHDVYATVLGGQPHPGRLVERLGDEWSILDGYTKLYACCQHLHAAVEAAIGLYEAGLDAEGIDSVGVDCHPLALAFVNAAPATTLGAKFSMPHAVAAALTLGQGGSAAFSTRSLADPRIARLRPLVVLREWTGPLTPPHDRPARVSVKLRSGQTASAECRSALGGPDRPLPQDAWKDKMRALAQPAYPRIVGLFSELAAVDERRLAQTWAQIAHEITRP